MFGGETFVGKHGGQTFVVVFQQVCTYLARPLHDFNVLLFEPVLCCLGCMFWVIVMLEDPTTTHFQCSHWGKEVVAQNFPVHGPIHPPLDTVKSSCPLSWETPPKHNHTSQWGWCSWGCTHHFSSSKNGVSSWWQLALFWSHLTTSPSPKPPPDHPGVLWQTSDRPVHVPSSTEEPCAQQDFDPSRCNVLRMVLFVTVVPTAFRSLTSSSYVVLGWSLTFLIIIDIPQGEILRGAPDRGRLAVTLCFFHFLIIAPTVVNFSPSYLLIFL